MELLIVTGVSGSGKTRAINALEDMGFFCVDNIPPRLLQKFSELCAQSAGPIRRVAIVVDARSKEMFGDLSEGLEELQLGNQPYKILFLEAGEDVILRRYKETRRRHPLVESENQSIEEAIRAERKMLEKVRSQADYVVDTSLISGAQLRERIANLFLEEAQQSMVVQCMSFGFKYGLPAEADLVFDVRCLPNPFYIPELRNQTGLDEAVREYVMSKPQAQGLIPHLLGLLDYLIPLYQEEGKSQLVVAIGCTGGMHRSVVFTKLLYEHLNEKGCRVGMAHRDMNRR